MATQPFRFVHPGTFMSPAMTKSLAADVVKNPVRWAALQKLIATTPLTWKARALRDVSIDWGGKGVGHDECTKDGEMAVAAALIFWATGDKKYGELAVVILKAWATVNVSFKGNNAPLEAAWSVCSMARAAELLKHSVHDDIRKAWREIEPAFFVWLDKLIMPLLRDAGVWRWPKNNWHFSMLCARMQIAILREDYVEWDWCVKTYREIFPKALMLVSGNSCCRETVERDLTHGHFALGGMIQAPEMALHQGVQLYDMRLLDCVELQSRIMMKDVPQGLKLEDIKTPYGYWPEPIYEIAFAHFHGRMKKEMPYTAKFLSQPRVRPDRVTFHWGGNTLTHA